MKIKLTHTVGYQDVDPRMSMRLSVLLRRFQEAAIAHSQAAGDGPSAHPQRPHIWLMNKLAVAVQRYPRFGEAVEIVTWSRGATGLRAARDFQARCGEEILASASSLWLYFDRAAKRPRKVPEAIMDAYTTETAVALEADLAHWKFADQGALAIAGSVSVRHSDIDANRHVNNAVYVDYLETVLARREEDYGGLAALKISYLREIDWQTAQVDVRLDDHTGGRFALSGGDTLFAGGEYRLSP